MVGSGSGATGFPDIIACQTESTSIVAAAVSARGTFFSVFLDHHNQHTTSTFQK